MLCLSTQRPGSRKHLNASVQAPIHKPDQHLGKMLISLILLSLIPCHLAVFALTLPLSTNVTTEPNPPNVPTNAEAHCPPEQSHLPLSRDCMRAIRALPDTHYVGTFHYGSPENLWRLPVSRSYESCKVSVTLNEDVDREAGSWEDVQWAGIYLLLWCRKTLEPGGAQRTGGWIASGVEEGVVVRLIKRGYLVENGTGAGMETGMDLVGVE